MLQSERDAVRRGRMGRKEAAEKEEEGKRVEGRENGSEPSDEIRLSYGQRSWGSWMK
jgi:hypothetical protein